MSNILAAIMPGPNADVELREFPEPELEPGSALLRTELSEVCGTDVHLLHGRLSGVPYPIIPGHVSAGTIEKLRGRMHDVHGTSLEEGDRVTFLDVHKTCHACWYCLVAKASTRCPQRKVYGITYGIDDGLTGGWSRKIHLKAGTHVIKLDGVATELFMAGGCSLPTALHAVERGRVLLGETVLVLGCGPVGLSAVILSKLQGAARVMCIGAPTGRLDTAARIGADPTLEFTTKSEADRIGWVRELTEGRGADLTIEATGHPHAVVEAMRYTRDAGRVVVVGQYTDTGEVSFNPHLDLNRKHLDILGCWGSDYSHFFRGIEVMRTDAARRAWGSLELTRFSLAQTNEALAAVADGRCVKAIIDPVG